MKKIKIFTSILAILFLASPMASHAKPAIVKADKILIEKSKRRMTLYKGGEALKTYRISLGRNPVGPKTRQGDGKTPEGKYVIDWRNPKSQYYLSLHISYPNAENKKQAAELGADPGGMIMIHGLPNSLKSMGVISPLIDWTDGCIAVTNEEMDEIWQLAPDGVEVEIIAMQGIENPLGGLSGA